MADTERTHLDRAEELADQAEEMYEVWAARESNPQECFRRAEVLAQMAAARAQLACARALTAEVPGSPRTPPPPRLTGTNLRDLP